MGPGEASIPGFQLKWMDIRPWTNWEGPEIPQVLGRPGGSTKLTVDGAQALGLLFLIQARKLGPENQGRDGY